MKEAAKYREYAADCNRLADKARDGDREALMRIAHAWEQQAMIAEAAAKRKRE